MAKKEGRRVETWTFESGKSGGRVAPRGRGRATVQVGKQVGKDKTTVKNRTGRGRGEVKEPDEGAVRAEGGGLSLWLLGSSTCWRKERGRENREEAEEGE